MNEAAKHGGTYQRSPCFQQILRRKSIPYLEIISQPLQWHGSRLFELAAKAWQTYPLQDLVGWQHRRVLKGVRPGPTRASVAGGSCSIASSDR